MEYHVTIEETVSDEFIIEANNIDELKDKVNKMYRNSELVLEPGNLLEAKFYIQEDKDNEVNIIY